MIIMQRIVDCLASFLGLILLFPLFVVIGLVVKLYDGGPVLYRARRVGKNGRLFWVYKFRSMVQDADKTGGSLTLPGDGRVTPIGGFLRAHKLDEFPQLFNVLRGDMSLVGPRPEDPRYVAHYTPEQRQLLHCRPGVTSPASMRFREEETLLHGGNWEENYTKTILPRKLAIELEYLPRRSMWTDMNIILQTLRGNKE